MMFEDRFRQLDELCQKLQVVATQLTRAVESLPKGCGTVNSAQQSNPTHQEGVALYGSSLPVEISAASENYEPARSPSVADRSQSQTPENFANSNGEGDEDSMDQSPQDDPTTSVFGSLVQDSCGNQR
jgi:hypothetical protein